MLREGRGKFSLSAGRYHSGESVRSPEFLQGTLFYGLTAGFTLYGGTQLARDYQAWALGLGRGFGEFGSLGGCHQPSPVRRRASATGHSLRAQYQKILSARALRSASPAIATRQAAITILPKPAPLKAPRAVDNRRRRKSCRCRKALVAGSLAVSARSQEYWHRQSRDEKVHLGSTAPKGSPGVGYYYTRASGQQK